jgi:hypothetical protein
MRQEKWSEGRRNRLFRGGVKMVQIRIPYKDENKEKLRDLCWTAYKTSRTVFYRDGECAPVLMCEVEVSPDGQKKTSMVVCNVPMDEKRMAIHYLTEKFKLLKPIRFAFVTEAYATSVNIETHEKKIRVDTLMCQGSDRYGNFYSIMAEIVKPEDSKIKKLENEQEGFMDQKRGLWDGLFE